jgi:hypothetical protein
LSEAVELYEVRRWWNISKFLEMINMVWCLKMWWGIQIAGGSNTRISIWVVLEDRRFNRFFMDFWGRSLEGVRVVVDGM